MAFAFGHGQAVVMRFDAANQNVVAVNNQVVGRDGGGQILIGAFYIIHPVRCGDMFHNHAQIGGFAPDRVQHAVDEHRLAVKDVNIGVGDFAMHAQRQANFGHAFQHAAHAVKIRHARRGIGGCPRRIQLYRRNQV